MARKLRILIFSTNYLPNVGGAEIAIHEIANRTTDNSYDLVTARISRKLPKEENVGQVHVHRVGLGFWFDKFTLPVLGFLKARSLNKDRRFDLSWSMMASQASVAASFFKIFTPRVPLLLTLQEGDEEDHLKRYVLGNDVLYKIFIQPWHLMVFHRANMVSAISSYLADRARKYSSAPVEIVPNGVDLDHFSNAKKDSARIRQSIGVSAKGTLLITTSRLVKKNAVDDVIRALQLLPEDASFAVLGTGPDEEKLRILAKEKKVSDRVFFLGHIEHDDLPEYLYASDVFVRPSLSEGMGNSFIEAMAAGLPVIATQVGGISDFLFDPELNLDHKATGRAVNVHDPEGIAYAAKYYKEHPEETKMVIANARALVQSSYDWNVIAKQMQQVFDKLLSKS